MDRIGEKGGLLTWLQLSVEMYRTVSSGSTTDGHSKQEKSAAVCEASDASTTSLTPAVTEEPPMLAGMGWPTVSTPGPTDRTQKLPATGNVDRHRCGLRNLVLGCGGV